MKLNKGYTLMHEHMALDLSGVKNDPDTCYDCVDDIVEEIKELASLGVGNSLIHFTLICEENYFHFQTFWSTYR